MDSPNGIIVDLSTIIAVVGAILTPLLTVIGALWMALNAERKSAKEDKDKAQEKIDSARKEAMDSFHTSINALNSMTSAIAVFKSTQLEESSKLKDYLNRIVKEELSRLKDDLLNSMKGGSR